MNSPRVAVVLAVLGEFVELVVKTFPRLSAVAKVAQVSLVQVHNLLQSLTDLLKVVANHSVDFTAVHQHNE